jgi:hypothetical protein
MTSLPVCASGLLMLAAASWPQQTGVPVTAAPRTFLIGGTVVHAITGQSLAQVEVSILPVASMQNPDAAQSMLSGEDGSFRFEGLSPGKYTLVAERRGFPRQALDEHGAFSTAIAVGPGLVSEGIVFRLRPDCSISGVITDDLNEPVREAQVMLFRDVADEGETVTTLIRDERTDDLGHYHFSHLPPGRYVLGVSARPWYAQETNQLRPALPAVVEAADESGPEPAAEPSTDSTPEQSHSPLDVAYPLTYYPGVKEANGATPLVLKPGEQAAADLALTPLPAVRLRIHMEHIDPSQGFGADLAQRGLGGQTIPVPIATASGPNKGDIDIVGIAPGEYVVSVMVPGKQPLNWKQTVELSDNLEINGATGPPLSSLSGAVTVDGQPAPIQGQVSLRKQDSKESLGASIGPNGEFDLAPGTVEAGVYEVSVSNVPKAAITAITATGARVEGQTVTIGGTAPVRLAISMSAGLGSVTGVALLEGKPQAGVMVVLVPENPENNAPRFRRDQSDSDGTFTLANVVPGKYTVLALANGWDLEWGKAAVLQPYLAGGETVEVAATSKHAVKVKVQ